MSESETEPPRDPRIDRLLSTPAPSNASRLTAALEQLVAVLTPAGGSDVEALLSQVIDSGEARSLGGSGAVGYQAQPPPDGALLTDRARAKRTSWALAASVSGFVGPVIEAQGWSTVTLQCTAGSAGTVLVETSNNGTTWNTANTTATLAAPNVLQLAVGPVAYLRVVATDAGGSGSSLSAVLGDGYVNVGNFPASQPVSGSVSVSNFPATQPVSGTVSVSDFPAIQPVSGSVSVSNFPASQAVTDATAEGYLATIEANTAQLATTQPVSGAVSVSNFPATQPVSGTVSVSDFPATQPVSAVSLPLPTGAALELGGQLQQLNEYVQQLVIELRIHSLILGQGLNVKDDPAPWRSDPAFLN
jgi:hypothetical protein